MKVIMGKNKAWQQVEYLKQATLKKNYPGASPQDVIRVKMTRPDLQKEPVYAENAGKFTHQPKYSKQYINIFGSLNNETCN